MTKVAEKKKKRSTATDSRGGSFKGHRESRTNAQSRRGRKTGRSSVMGSMLRGIRRSIAWVDFKSTKDNAAGNDPHDGEKEDDSFWFKTHWQSVVEEWMTCVTSRPSEEIDTKVLQSLFIEINFSKIGVDGDDNVSEELGGGSLESGAAVSCLRLSRHLLQTLRTCLHQRRHHLCRHVGILQQEMKWKLATTYLVAFIIYEHSRHLLHTLGPCLHQRRRHLCRYVGILHQEMNW